MSPEPTATRIASTATTTDPRPVDGERGGRFFSAEFTTGFLPAVVVLTLCVTAGVETTGTLGVVAGFGADPPG
jgi:hypothetical protein